MTGSLIIFFYIFFAFTIDIFDFRRDRNGTGRSLYGPAPRKNRLTFAPVMLKYHQYQKARTERAETRTF